MPFNPITSAALLYDKTISDNAFRALCILVMLAGDSGRVIAPRAAIRAATRRSPATIDGYLANLVHAGYATWVSGTTPPKLLLLIHDKA